MTYTHVSKLKSKTLITKIIFVTALLLFTGLPLVNASNPTQPTEFTDIPSSVANLPNPTSLDQTERNLSFLFLMGLDNGLGVSMEAYIGPSFRIELSFTSLSEGYTAEINLKQLFTVATGMDGKSDFKLGFGFGTYYIRLDRPILGYERMSAGELSGVFARPNLELEYHYIHSKLFSSVYKIQIGVNRNYNDDRKIEFYKQLEYKPRGLPVSLRLAMGLAF